MDSSQIFNFSPPEEELRRRQKKYVSWFAESGAILDIGCGEGVFVELAHQAGLKAEGVELNREAAIIAASRGIRCHHQNAFDFLQNATERYDGVFCSNFIEHFHPDKAMMLIKLCRQALKPGGVTVIVTPNPRSRYMLTETFWADPTHIRFYPDILLHKMLKAEGFTVLASGEDPDTRFRPQTWKQKAREWVNTITLPRNLRESNEIFVVCKKCSTSIQSSSVSLREKSTFQNNSFSEG